MKNLLILLICLTLFTTCKKYPEGGYHFRYLKNLEGDWKLKLYEVDGIDSTFLTQGNNNIPNYLSDLLHIAIAHSGKRAEIGWFSHSEIYSVYFNKTNKDIIQVTSHISSQLVQRNIFSPTYDQYFNWKIEKLTKDEFILLSIPYNYKLILTKK